jgi:hypothetical protein
MQPARVARALAETGQVERAVKRKSLLRFRVGCGRADRSSGSQQRIWAGRHTNLTGQTRPAFTAR